MRVRRIDGGGLRGEVAIGSAVDDLLVGEADVEEWFSGPGEVLKEDGAIQVRLLTGRGRETIFAKRFGAKDRLHALKAALGRQRGPHLWRITRAFQAAGLPVPEPFGYLLRGRGGGSVSYFFGEALTRVADLLVISRRRGDFSVWLSDVDLMARVGETFGRMHQHGLTHGDTKWANIAVDEGTGQFWLLDLDSARRSGRHQTRRMWKDVARFLVSAIDAEVGDNLTGRYLSAYAATRGIPPYAVERGIGPLVASIIARHRRQYGSG
jgi:tRNA A-37 threonylcarbamoyl transferase component Bud32